MLGCLNPLIGKDLHMDSNVLCISCNKPIPAARVDYFREEGLSDPVHCIDCAPKDIPMGFMGPEGKTGVGHLNIVDPLDKRTLHNVKQWHKRGANHCTAG